MLRAGDTQQKEELNLLFGFNIAEWAMFTATFTTIPPFYMVQSSEYDPVMLIYVEIHILLQAFDLDSFFQNKYLL